MLKLSPKGLIQSLAGVVMSLALATAAFAADGHKMMDRLQSKLNLSDTQVSQLQPLFDNYRQQRKAEMEQFKAKMQTVLTADQQAQLAQLQAQRKQEGKACGPRGGRKGFMSQLNLSDDQKAQLKSYWQANRPQLQAERNQFQSQVMAVLTPDQQTQYQQMMQRHRHHHEKSNS